MRAHIQRYAGLSAQSGADRFARAASGWAAPSGWRVFTLEGLVMERDVVCGMQVDPAKAAATSVYAGKKYYFCSNSCKAKFDASPVQYAK